MADSYWITGVRTTHGFVSFLPSSFTLKDTVTLTLTLKIRPLWLGTGVAGDTELESQGLFVPA